MFLKRQPVAGISQDNLYLGSIVTIFARQLKLVDYGDTFTRTRFAEAKETTFALIKPDVYVHTGKIIDAICSSGYVISKLRMGKFNAATAARFMQIQQQTNAETAKFLTSDVSTGIEIVKKDAIKDFKSLVGDL